jgi:hypothetical protein
MSRACIFYVFASVLSTAEETVLYFFVLPFLAGCGLGRAGPRLVQAL